MMYLNETGLGSIQMQQPEQFTFETAYKKNNEIREAFSAQIQNGLGTIKKKKVGQAIAKDLAIRGEQARQDLIHAIDSGKIDHATAINGLELYYNQNKL